MITLFCQEISEHRYDVSISESCVDPNPLKVERQDPDNFTRFQTRERCALEIAAYVFKWFGIMTDTYAFDVVTFDFKGTRVRCFVSGYTDYQLDYS